MPRSIVGHTSNDFNEISVSSQSAEPFQASVSVEQPSSEVSVEQLRLSASVEQDRSSFDDLTEIQRPPRSGGIPQHRSILVRVSIIEIALSPQRHLLVAGHDTGNGRRESIATILATARAVTIRPREGILIVHLGRMVIAVREDMTLERRADAVVILMTEMSAPVEDIGHPTETLEIMMTGLAEIRILTTGSRYSWVTIALQFRE